MTIATEFFNWQQHAEDPEYDYCSPNLLLIVRELKRRWGTADLGCYGERAIRSGVLPSSHSHGAATDQRYTGPGVGRVVGLTEIIPWLIDNSAELRVQAIHDYIGCRIWRAGRTNDVGDAHTKWWKTQPKSGDGMGQTWAGWFHIEVSKSGWHDSTPLSDRGKFAPPVTVPIIVPGGTFMHATVKLNDANADVFALQAVLKFRSNPNVIVDGKFGQMTETAVRNLQSFCGLKADGIVGAKTWAIIDVLANSPA